MGLDKLNCQLVVCSRVDYEKNQYLYVSSNIFVIIFTVFTHNRFFFTKRKLLTFYYDHYHLMFIFVGLLFLCRFLSNVWLKFHKFLCYLVVTTLPENSQNRPASFILRNAFEQGKPSGARTLQRKKFFFIKNRTEKFK